MIKVWQEFWRLNSYLAKHFWLSLGVVFLISFSIFSYLQNFPGFVDPDSFYHAKITTLFLEQGVIKNFYWLPLTTLGQSFADHHFLYHLFLIPFVLLFQPLVGVKISAIIFASLAVVTIFFLLYTHEPKASVWGSLLIFSSGPWLFRASLAKAPMLSVIWLLLILWFLWKKNNIAVFILSFFAVWLHGSWPLVLIFVIINHLVNSFYDGFFQSNKNQAYQFGQEDFGELLIRLRRFYSALSQWSGLRQVLAVISGLLAGLIINPYFPQNLLFYWRQIIQIAVWNYGQQISVGGEWYSFGLMNLVAQDSALFILFVVIVVLLFWGGYKHLQVKTVVLGILALMFFGLTLRAGRNIEYFIPLFLLFIIYFLVDIYQRSPQVYVNCWLWFKKTLKQFSGVRTFLVYYLLLAVIIDIVFGVLGSRATLEKNIINYFYLAKASQWLKNNTPAQSLVFHDNWSTWPEIWYYNDHNTYLVGLDPTFMYLYNPGLYREMVDITLGKQKQNLWRTIKQDFGAQYVMVDKYHNDFLLNLLRDPGFVRVYQDEQAYVFEVK